MNADEIVSLASSQGLKISGPIKLNEMGLDFLVAFVTEENGKKWVLRIPRRPDAFERAEHEKKILEFIKTRISVQVPEWQIFHPKLIAYPMLNDQPALTFDATTHEVAWHMDSKSPLFVESFAKTLVELHRISPQEASEAGLTVCSPSDIRQNVKEELETVRKTIGLSKDLENRYEKWINDATLWPKFTVFGHGDLYAGHLLVDSNTRVTGIIDWTEAKVNDPSIDFTGHLTVFNEESLKTLIKHYENNGGRVWPELIAQTIERAAFSPVRYGIFAITSGSDTHLAAAKALLNPA
jgi:macrolide phosphotransferase